MDAGFEHRGPERDPQQAIDQRLAHAETVGEDEGDHDRGGEPDGAPVDFGCVEDGDDQDGEEIIDNRERREKDRQSLRNPVAEERQHAEGERDVGRHWDAPAGGPWCPLV
jgi:hypothetical protein